MTAGRPGSRSRQRPTAGQWARSRRWSAPRPRLAGSRMCRVGAVVEDVLLDWRAARGDVGTGAGHVEAVGVAPADHTPGLGRGDGEVRGPDTLSAVAVAWEVASCAPDHHSASITPPAGVGWRGSDRDRAGGRDDQGGEDPDIAYAEVANLPGPGQRRGAVAHRPRRRIAGAAGQLDDDQASAGRRTLRGRPADRASRRSASGLEQAQGVVLRLPLVVNGPPRRLRTR